MGARLIPDLSASRFDGLADSVEIVIGHERAASRCRADSPSHRQEKRMRATRIFANLRVADIEAARSFYTDYLGLSNEEFNMGWVARYASADAKAKVQLVTSDATAPEDSVISVCTDDIDGAYAEAQELGYEIVHPLSTEAWGLRRFFVRAPDGNLINIVNHRD
jgi:catechol 2,3-dioxygenase-like lactoylglutathione lyase family enzyme